MIEKFKPPAADTEVVHCFSREEREERVELEFWIMINFTCPHPVSTFSTPKPGRLPLGSNEIVRGAACKPEVFPSCRFRVPRSGFPRVRRSNRTTCDLRCCWRTLCKVTATAQKRDAVKRCAKPGTRVSRKSPGSAVVSPATSEVGRSW